MIIKDIYGYDLEVKMSATCESYMFTVSRWNSVYKYQQDITSVGQHKTQEEALSYGIKYVVDRCCEATEQWVHDSLSDEQ